MSSINGDKARFHRKRKSKLAQRERNRELRKKLDAAAAPASPATPEKPFQPL
jgi:hypothetical protein